MIRSTKELDKHLSKNTIRFTSINETIDKSLRLSAILVLGFIIVLLAVDTLFNQQGVDKLCLCASFALAGFMIGKQGMHYKVKKVIVTEAADQLVQQCRYKYWEVDAWWK